MIIDKGNLSLKQYEETEPPYRLPDNMDVFTWSIPFLAEKVTNMLYNLVRRGGDDDPDVDLDKVVRDSSIDEK